MAVDSLRALRADRFDYWKAQHLLNRAGFGGTPGQVRALANLGLSEAVDYIVDYDKIDWPPVEAEEFDPDIMRPRTRTERQELVQARQSGDESVVEQFRQQRQARQRADRTQIAELRRWWLTRLIETSRPLQEKLTLFWHGHF
ncbi:MAG: DUF1800 family protein, partial [Planctomycetes bacterium]|nr:DUF1800 family protein [Planctomycetota bacterium]